MSISDGVKFVTGPVKTLVVDRIVQYLKFIKSYEDNMNVLVEKLEILCAKKLDLDAKVMKSKENMEVMTRETANWLKSLYKLIERVEMKELMREERVAGITVKMMNQRVMKKLFKEDREIFDILVHAVKKKCSLQADDAEEDADYKKVAKIAREVMKDISEEFKKFIKTDDAAVAAVNLLSYTDLEKLRKDDEEMAKILIKAEGINRWEVEHHDHDDQPVDKTNIVNKKVGFWRKHMGSLMAFLDDENFKKDLPDGVKIGLEVMDAFNNSSKSTGHEQVEANDKSHRYCGCCVVRFKVYSHRHDMSVVAEIMVEAINSMILECPLEHVTRSIRDDELEIIPSEFVGGLDSREALMQRILLALKDDQVNIVGVFGMGGSGKTLLAKEIVHKRASDLFNKRVVVEVSEAPNIKGIQNQIAGEIGLILDDMHTLARRARILYNKLKAEKILIILDNVWKKLKLEEVGIPCESTKDFCCKLFITTREKQVCRVMDVQNANIFEVGMLNDREALNLFENQTGKKVDSGEFKPMVDRLLITKCGGLPLAIVTTASALRGKNLEMWCQFAQTSEKFISSQVSSEYHEIYSILETSYKLMDSEEKKLFFFLVCLSPLDSAITVEDLMRYGIGLDLFQRVNDLSEAMGQANMWVSELTSSSLLLKGDSDGEVKIHDLVRASAISFIDKGKNGMTLVERIPRWMCKDTFKKVTTISLMSGDDYSRLSGVNAPMLEILLLKGDVSLTTLNSDFFGGMKNLKVLSLSNMNFNLGNGLPESMGELKRLQTLHLHYCKLKDIKLIGKLVNLLVLSLRESSLEELAIETGELYNLRLLDIRGCKGVKRIPANILSRLAHLEGLYMLNVFDRWADTNAEVNDGGDYKPASGSELDTLSHLNVLEMDVCRAGQLLTVNNSQLAEQLKKFKIRVNSYGISEEVPALHYVLELRDINGSPSNWLRALLKKSERLVLSHCKRLTDNIIPQLDEDGFKDLKYLIVKQCQVKCLISSNEQDESTAFPSLEVLWLEHMNLAMICDEKAPADIFSNLRRLKLISLPKLKCGLPLTSGSLNLSEVSIDECASLEFVASKDASVAKNETNYDLFPCLKSLQLSFVPNLSSVVEQSLNDVFSLFNAESKYPSLESLELLKNYTIVTLWSRECYVSSFQGLKVLRIDQCSELRSLGFPSIFAALVRLEELRISECENLQEIISKEIEEDEVRERVISFPLLKHLSLERLEKIERFYGGSYKLEFPILKSPCLSIAQLLTNFNGSENSITFFSDKIEFPRLEEMDVLTYNMCQMKLRGCGIGHHQVCRDKGAAYY